MHYTASLSTTHDALHIAMVRPLSQRRQSFSDGAGRRPIQGSSSDVYYSEQWRRNEFEICFGGGGTIPAPDFGVVSIHLLDLHVQLAYRCMWFELSWWAVQYSPFIVNCYCSTHSAPAHAQPFARGGRHVSLTHYGVAPMSVRACQLLPDFRI